MLEVVKAHQRDQASMHLRFLRAISVAVPASFDSKLVPDFEKTEAKLIREIQSL